MEIRILKGVSTQGIQKNWTTKENTVLDKVTLFRLQFDP